MERGTTGIREAIVMDLMAEDNFDHASLHGVTWPKVGVDVQPIVAKDAEDLHAQLRERPLFLLPSDDKQFDQLFPEHPLSLVRARMARVAGTMKLYKNWWEKLKPLRSRH